MGRLPDRAVAAAHGRATLIDRADALWWTALLYLLRRFGVTPR